MPQSQGFFFSEMATPSASESKDFVHSQEQLKDAADLITHLVITLKS